MDAVSCFQQIIAPPAPWMVSQVVFSEDRSRIDVWLKHNPFTFVCHKCGKPAPIYDHAPEREWRHLDICEYQTFLHASIPRVSCPEHGVVNGTFQLAEPNVSISHKMECKCITTMQQCDISGASNILCVSWDILAGTQKRAVERGIERRGNSVPTRMGIDEKQVFAHHKYFTITTDMDTGAVYDVMDKRKIDDIAPWFEERKKELEKVKLVAMDMSAGYGRIARDYMGNAELCYDHFHIIKTVQVAVDETRKEEQKTLSKENKKFLYGARYDFLFGRENLPEKNSQRFEAAKKIATKTAKAWAIKESLRDMWRQATNNANDAEVYFKKWFWWATHSRLPAIAEAAHTLKRHWHGIEAAIRNGVSNALTEGLNNKIESVKRDACGFRNKESFRNAIMFHCGKLDMMPRMP